MYLDLFNSYSRVNYYLLYKELREKYSHTTVRDYSDWGFWVVCPKFATYAMRDRFIDSSSFFGPYLDWYYYTFYKFKKYRYLSMNTFLAKACWNPYFWSERKLILVFFVFWNSFIGWIILLLVRSSVNKMDVDRKQFHLDTFEQCHEKIY